MREPRTGERFAAENKKLEQQVIAAAAVSMYSGTATAGPHVPTPLDDAHHVVDLERRRLEGTSSGRRNDPTDLRPTLKEVEASRRWGPPASLPTTPPVVQVTRQQLAGAILELNRRLGERHLADEATKAERDRLTAQLAALEGRAG